MVQFFRLMSIQAQTSGPWKFADFRTVPMDMASDIAPGLSPLQLEYYMVYLNWFLGKASVAVFRNCIVRHPLQIDEEVGGLSPHRRRLRLRPPHRHLHLLPQREALPLWPSPLPISTQPASPSTP